MEERVRRGLDDYKNGGALWLGKKQILDGEKFKILG
jgi:hypothetical protein